MASIKLKKIDCDNAQHYVTEDSRFIVFDRYVPGQGGRNRGLVSQTDTTRWEINAIDGSQPFTKWVRKGVRIPTAIKRFSTLRECREAIAEILFKKG